MKGAGEAALAWGHGTTRGFAVIPMGHEGWKLGWLRGDRKGKVDWRLLETEGAGLVGLWWVGRAWGAESSGEDDSRSN